MTNTVQTQNKKKPSNVFLMVSISIMTFMVLLVLLYIAYQHGDGTAYSTGYEMGTILNGLFGHSVIKNGIGLGSLIAAVTSWERNKSILWSVVHAFFGWLYVIYFALSRKGKV